MRKTAGEYTCVKRQRNEKEKGEKEKWGRLDREREGKQKN